MNRRDFLILPFVAGLAKRFKFKKRKPPKSINQAAYDWCTSEMPGSPPPGFAYLDTSCRPPVLKQWDGERWLAMELPVLPAPCGCNHLGCKRCHSPGTSLVYVGGSP